MANGLTPEGIEEAAQRAIDHLQATGERDGELLDGLRAIVRECRQGRVVVLIKSPGEAGWPEGLDTREVIGSTLEDISSMLDPYEDRSPLDDLERLEAMLGWEGLR